MCVLGGGGGGRLYTFKGVPIILFFCLFLFPQKNVTNMGLQVIDSNFPISGITIIQNN